MKEAFEYPKEIPLWRWERERKEKGTTVKTLSFPSWIKTGYPENDTVKAEIYYPSSLPAPLVLVIHSWREGFYGPTHKLSLDLAWTGFLPVRMHLPYHLERTPYPHSSGSLFLTTDMEKSMNSFYQSVIDLRTCLDIVISQENIEEGKVGAVGVSLGAIILHTLMGVEKRIKAGVSILGGGNLNDIIAKGVATLPILLMGVKKGFRWRHYRMVRDEFENFLKEVKEKGREKVTPRWRWFLFDPLTYAQPGREVLFINGIFDLVIPRHCVVRLWKELGSPPIKWLPVSHFTSFFFYPLIRKYTVSYLKEKLGKEGEK